MSTLPFSDDLREQRDLDSTAGSTAHSTIVVPYHRPTSKRLRSGFRSLSVPEDLFMAGSQLPAPT